MWQQRSSRTVTPLWKLVCAMAVSSGVLSFPLSAPKKDGTAASSYLGSSAWGMGWIGSMNHQLARTNPHVTRCEAAPQPLAEESFEKMSIPDRGFYGEGHAIFGVLLGENMIESYEVYKRPEGSNDENVIIAHVKLGDKIDGHPGVVHGGILSLIFDDALGFGFEALGVGMAFTANLNVDFRAPVPAGTMIRVLAQLEHREGRKLFWKAQMMSMDGETLFAECSSLYIIPRSHA
jgi:acyl-coenzyme A thioesterase PaaI-like protein